MSITNSIKCTTSKVASNQLKSAFLQKTKGIPRYQNFPGTCSQLLSAHLLVKETQRLRPMFNTLAYIGAHADYYFAETCPSSKKNVQELFMMDNSMEMSAMNVENLSDQLLDAQKWFLQADYDNWLLEENLVDLILMNDGLNINFSEDLGMTIRSMTSSLKRDGMIIGTSTCEEAVAEIKDAAKDNKKSMQVLNLADFGEELPNMLMYNIKK